MFYFMGWRPEQVLLWWSAKNTVMSGFPLTFVQLWHFSGFACWKLKIFKRNVNLMSNELRRNWKASGCAQQFQVRECCEVRFRLMSADTTFMLCSISVKQVEYKARNLARRGSSSWEIKLDGSFAFQLLWGYSSIHSPRQAVEVRRCIFPESRFVARVSEDATHHSYWFLCNAIQKHRFTCNGKRIFMQFIQVALHAMEMPIQFNTRIYLYNVNAMDTYRWICNGSVSIHMYRFICNAIGTSKFSQQDGNVHFTSAASTNR